MATIRKQGRRRGGTKRQRGAAERGGRGGKSLSRRMLTRARAFIQRDGLFPKSDHATWRAERGKDGETERIEAPPRRIGNWGKPVVATEKSHACGQVWVEVEPGPPSLATPPRGNGRASRTDGARPASGDRRAPDCGKPVFPKKRRERGCRLLCDAVHLTDAAAHFGSPLVWHNLPSAP